MRAPSALDPTVRLAEPDSIETVASALSSLRNPSGAWIVSCYLELEPEDRTRKRYLAELKSRADVLRPTAEAQVTDHGKREALMRDLADLLDYCAAPERLPRARGAAVFVSRALDLFSVIPLPRVHRSLLVIDQTPFLQPLVAVQDAVGRILTVVIDQSHARIFEVTAFRATEVIDVRGSSARGRRFHSDRQDAPGYGEYTYHNRVRTERDRHFATVGRRVRELDRRSKARGLVVVGPGPVADTFARFLPPELGARVMGTARMAVKQATAAAVVEATQDVTRAHARQSECDAIDELRAALGTGWAVNGVRETLRALSRGQVRSLFVTENGTASGYRCAASGRMVVTRDECPDEEGPVVPAPYLIDDVLAEGFRQGIPVTVVHDDDHEEAVERLAALLRFR